MKITQLMVARGFGGAERYFVDLTLALAGLGHEIQAIYHQRFRQAERFAAYPNIACVPVQVFGWWDPLAAWRIRRSITKFQPGIIHAHLARGSYLAGKSARGLGVPLVSMTHNYVDLSYYRQVDMFIPATQDQRRFLTEQGIPAEKTCVIPNFSAFPPCDHPRPATPDAPVRFVAYGRLVRKKGFDVLLRAFRALLDQGFAARLVLAGGGPEAPALAGLARELGLTEAVEFTGWCDDVAGLLASHDVFVLPSLDEPFGIVVLEAMAMQMPIVATRTQGPREVLDGETAYLAEVGDVKTLTEAMAQALRDPAASARKAHAAQERYRTRYHSGVVVPRIVGLYERVEMNIRAQ
jgi:glycosyltransferase involved in cell wall biosynthesis